MAKLFTLGTKQALFPDRVLCPWLPAIETSITPGYGMFESVTQMLEQRKWTPLSKRRENSLLILFYKNYQQFGCGTTFMSGKG